MQLQGTTEAAACMADTLQRMLPMHGIRGLSPHACAQSLRVMAQLQARVTGDRWLQDLEDAPKVMGPDALLKTIGKKHRHRTGYDAGTSLVHKTVTAVEFVRCNDPMPTLGTTSAILLEKGEACATATRGDAEAGAEADGSDDAEHAGRFSHEEAVEFVLGHKETVPEVQALCRDLQVLGRSEFKQLLRWRLKVRKDLEAAEKARAKAAQEVRARRMLRMHTCGVQAQKMVCAVQAPGGSDSSGGEEDSDGREEGGEGETQEDRLVQEMEGVRKKELQVCTAD
jgi:Domain of unknown function (DUF3381)